MLKNNKIKIFIFTLIIGIFSFYGFKMYAKQVKNQHCLTTQISSKLFDFNEFELKVDATLDINHFEVVNQNSGKTIFKNGKNKKGIKNDYGYCIFELFWKGKKIYQLNHFKTNNWETHHYLLNIKVKNEEIEPHLTVNHLKKDKSLVEIEKIK